MPQLRPSRPRSPFVMCMSSPHSSASVSVDGSATMTVMIARTLNRLEQQLPGRVSMPGEERYAAATAIWAKPVGKLPRAVVHCRRTEDVQVAIGAARNAYLPLSVRGGGHDWAGRALCDGLVIDLSGMRAVAVESDDS